jgi:hypothetical protein
MDVLYDDKYHLHLGYYEDNCDYESIAFKRQSEDIWDIFFDFKEYFLFSIKKSIMILEYSSLDNGYTLIK